MGEEEGNLDQRTTPEAALLVPLLLLFTPAGAVSEGWDAVVALSRGLGGERSVVSSSRCAELQDSPWVMDL